MVKLEKDEVSAKGKHLQSLNIISRAIPSLRHRIMRNISRMDNKALWIKGL